MGSSESPFKILSPFKQFVVPAIVLFVSISPNKTVATHEYCHHEYPLKDVSPLLQRCQTELVVTKVVLC